MPEIANEIPLGDLRGSILRAATELFAQRGFAATSMREVAEAARCTKPALYYYFKSKNALWLEAIGHETEGVAKLIEAQFRKPGTVRHRMQLALQSYFAHVRQNPVALRLLLRAEVHPEAGMPAFDFRSVRQMYIQMMATLLTEGVERGEIRAGVSAEDAMHAIAGIVELRCSLWVLEGDPIPDDYAERVLDLLFRGMGA